MDTGSVQMSGDYLRVGMLRGLIGSQVSGAKALDGSGSVRHT